MPSEPSTTVDPGALPQTDVLPEPSSPQLTATVAALWSGVVEGTAAPALESFFPEAAYLQLKDIPDPGADYRDRLLAAFGLDIAAAHRLLGPSPTSAVLVGLEIPPGRAHWVIPGECSNRIGYFEVANSRLVYVEDGDTRSFGVASLISWRGQWYVVYLGAVVRSVDAGVVDAPSVGPGVAAPLSTC